MLKQNYMDPLQQPPPFSVAAPAANTGVFGTKIPSAVAFTVGILLFLLPFAQVKCGGTVLAQNSGLGIAIGSEWKAAKGGGGLFDKNDLGGTNSTPDKQKKQDPNIYAIVALGLGVLGLLLSFANPKAGGTGGLVIGLLSAGALIGMMIDLKNSSQLKSPDVPKPDDGMLGLGNLNNAIPTMEFTPWFYIAVAAFLVAAFFCYRRMQLNKH
jgi:hypothetical protein